MSSREFSPKANFLNAQQRRELCRALLNWFRQHGRVLPWRKNKDPYRIWISEIMLQQTQVQTVVPYFRRFLRQFPHIEDLARAPLSEVLKAWAGLGYYARARNMKKAAEAIIQNFSGSFPRQYDQLLALPGIGRYTAGAILSIAFGEPRPLVDGNVARVFARLMLWDDLTNGSQSARLWTLAQELLPASSPGDFNEALMELGATICLPRVPQCPFCPWKFHCQAWAEGRQNSIPTRKKRLAPREVSLAAVVIIKRGRVLLIHRQGEKWLEGFWDFPQMEHGETQPAARIFSELSRQLGITIEKPRWIGSLRHGITRHRITYAIYLLRLDPWQEAAPKQKTWRWVSWGRLDQFPLGAVTRQMAQLAYASRRFLK